MDNSVDMEPAVQALMNPLLVNMVFTNLDVPTLKSARSVCTLWADLGVPFLGKQTSVTFSKNNCCIRNISESKELDSLHPKLTRSVGLTMTPPCNCVSLPYNFVTNLRQVSHLAVEFDVTMSSKFVPALQQMWRMHHFPNLRVLTLTVILVEVDHHFTSEDEDDEIVHVAHNHDQNEADNEVEFVMVTQKIPHFMILPNLKSLKIVVKDQNENDQDDGISSVCQELLNSSPNILRVAIDASFYPDFTTCTKLGMLTYTFIRFDDEWTEEPVCIDISSLTIMLDTCRNYLTTLTLGYDHDWETLAPPQTFMLPSIPNLTAIEIKNGNHPLGNFHLPNLTHATFSGYKSEYLSLTDIFQSCHVPHAKITSLDMETLYVSEVETATKIARLFPSVKTLRLKLVIFEDGVDFVELMDTLRSFAKWNLTSALVEIERVQDSTDILAALRGLVVWKDLTRTAINFVGYDWKLCTQFVLDYEMEEILLSCRSLKWIKMSRFRMKEDEKAKFEEFIEEHSLPISLSRWEED